MTQNTEDDGAPAAMTEAVEAVPAPVSGPAVLADEAMQTSADLARNAQAGAFDLGRQSRTPLQTWMKASAGKAQPMLAGLQGQAATMRGAMESSFTATATGLVAFNVAALQAMRANANASFDLWTSLAGARTIADAIALNADHMRKQMETVGAQTGSLSSLARRIVSAAAEPIRVSVQKAVQPSA